MHVLLAYASADGREPAARLAALLQAMGVAVVDAASGDAAPQDVGAIAVLTPAALADRAVLDLLQTASATGRPFLPLPAPAPASFPTASDLARVLEWRAAQTAPASAQGAKYYVAAAINSAVGDNAIAINTFGRAAGWSAEEVAHLAAALRARPTDTPLQAQELRELFAAVLAQTQQVERTLQQSFLLLLARFDLTEQRILSPLLARLDGQQAALVAAVLDALDSRAIPADELDAHLEAIQRALAELNARAAQISNQQLAAAVRRANELASAPSLEAKHKLKVTIPILPAVLAYEGEMELGSGLNLEEIWKALYRWAGRSE